MECGFYTKHMKYVCASISNVNCARILPKAICELRFPPKGSKVTFLPGLSCDLLFRGQAQGTWIDLAALNLDLPEDVHKGGRRRQCDDLANEGALTLRNEDLAAPPQRKHSKSQSHTIGTSFDERLALKINPRNL